MPLPPLAAIRGLRLEPLLLAILRNIDRQRDRQRREIADNIEDAETVPQAVTALLEGLVEHFGWDHAVMFVVQRGPERGEFRMFVQYPEPGPDGSQHPLAPPPGYSQPIYDPADPRKLDDAQARASGMLGAALRDLRDGGTGVLFAGDVRDPKTHGQPPHYFRSSSSLQASGLTVAIEIDGDVRWVLDTVSYHPNAFIDEDRERVRRLVRRLAKQIKNLRRASLNKALINFIDQGVVITDGAGLMLTANVLNKC